MLHQKICEDLHSVTSLPELVSGAMRCDRPDGETTSQFGQEVARASLSARQAKAAGLMTSGTYGLHSSGSLKSANLSTSLANRLQLVTQMLGSTLYKQTWKEWDTPLVLRRSRQRASVRPTSEKERTGWPTPLASNEKNCYQDWEKVLARKDAGRQQNLQDHAVLTGWVTPTSRDWKDTSGMTAQREGKERLDQLPRQAYTAGHLRLTVFGVMQTGSYVEMSNGVQLNPAHSRWLQGLPKIWDTVSPHYEHWLAATELSG